MWLDSLAGFLSGLPAAASTKLTSTAAILSLALGIGSCLAAFRLMDALLLRPLPIASPDRLYSLSHRELPATGPSATRDTWQYPLYQQMRSAVAGQAEVLAISPADRVEITFRSDREMERAHVQYVSGSLFSAFGLHAASGRLLSANDDLQPGAHPVAIVSHDYWTRRFARDPQIIGRTFRLTNNLTGTRIYQIVGVTSTGSPARSPARWSTSSSLPTCIGGWHSRAGHSFERSCFCGPAHRPLGWAITFVKSSGHSTKRNPIAQAGRWR